MNNILTNFNEEKIREFYVNSSKKDKSYAKEQIILFLDGVIKKNAFKYSSKYTYEDYCQEARTALLSAIDRFDFNSSNKLATYLSWTIKDSMQKLYRHEHNATTQNLKSLAKINRYLTKNPNASIDEIAKALAHSKTRILDVLKLQNSFFNMNTIEEAIDGTNLFSYGEDFYNTFYKNELKKELNQRFKMILSEDEYKIIICFFGFEKEKSIKEISEEDFNLSSESIRLKKNKAIKKIKEDKIALNLLYEIIRS